MQEKMILCRCDANHEMRFWAENEARARRLVKALEYRGCLEYACCQPVSLTICDLPLPDGSVLRVDNPEKKHG